MSVTTENLRSQPEETFERRREPRTRVDIPARLKSVDPVTSIGPSTVVRIVELSRNGLKIKVDHGFLPKSLVQVIASNQIMMGQVRHSTPVEGGFHVGVQLLEMIQPS
jgi:hypothetical protein